VITVEDYVPSPFDTREPSRVVARNKAQLQPVVDEAKATNTYLPNTVLHSTDSPKCQLIAYLAASGLNRREIAERVGMHYSQVNIILSQPEVKKQIRQIITENCGDEVEAFLKSEVVPSIEVLSEIAQDRNAPKSARVSAANSILDRACGKAVAKLEITRGPSAAEIDVETEELLKRNKELDLQLRAQGVGALKVQPHSS